MVTVARCLRGVLQSPKGLEPRRHQNGCQLGPGNAFLPATSGQVTNLLAHLGAAQALRRRTLSC